MVFCDVCNLYPKEVELDNTQHIQQIENILKFPDGDYRGDIRDNKPNGFGRYQKHSGGFHEGEWENGLPNGQGKVEYDNGEMYEGEFV